MSRRIGVTGGRTKQRVNFRNEKRLQYCNNMFDGKTLQFVTANATVTVEIRDKKIQETGFGINGVEYGENNFTNYFLKNISSKKISEIAEADGWPNDLKRMKQSEMDNVRNSINCAEPHSVINALNNAKSKINPDTPEEDIKSVAFNITEIKNDKNKLIKPCAVCRQWITTSDKGTGSGNFDKWIKAPLLGWKTAAPK